MAMPPDESCHRGKRRDVARTRQAAGRASARMAVQDAVCARAERGRRAPRAPRTRRSRRLPSDETSPCREPLSTAIHRVGRGPWVRKSPDHARRWLLFPQVCHVDPSVPCVPRSKASGRLWTASATTDVTSGATTGSVTAITGIVTATTGIVVETATTGIVTATATAATVIETGETATATAIATGGMATAIVTGATGATGETTMTGRVSETRMTRLMVARAAGAGCGTWTRRATQLRLPRTLAVVTTGQIPPRTARLPLPPSIQWRRCSSKP